MKAITRVGLATLISVASLTAVKAVEPAFQSDPPPTPPTNVRVADNVAPPAAGASASGIWISKTEIMALPTSGSGWTNLTSAASKACGTPDLTNQDETANTCILAKALVSVRLGNTTYRSEVVNALTTIVNSGSTFSGRALALGRKLAAYVIAADIIDLKTLNATLDSQFRKKIVALRDVTTTECGTLVQCHEKKPDNWGTVSGASRIAVDAYVGDTTDLAKALNVFKGYVGIRSAYAGFTFVSSSNPDLMSWSCVPTAPVAINPRGCTVGGHNVDGAPIRDIARGSSTGQFSWPPPHTLYPWTGMEGLLVQAEILARLGYDSYGWQDQAIRRTYQYLKYLHDATGGYWFDPAQATNQAVQVWIANKRYGTALPTSTPTHYGKLIGWTDWTHAR